MTSPERTSPRTVIGAPPVPAESDSPRFVAARTLRPHPLPQGQGRSRTEDTPIYRVPEACIVSDGFGLAQWSGRAADGASPCTMRRRVRQGGIPPFRLPKLSRRTATSAPLSVVARKPCPRNSREHRRLHAGYVLPDTPKFVSSALTSVIPKGWRRTKGAFLRQARTAPRICCGTALHFNRNSTSRESTRRCSRPVRPTTPSKMHGVGSNVRDLRILAEGVHVIDRDATTINCLPRGDGRTNVLTCLPSGEGRASFHT